MSIRSSLSYADAGVNIDAGNSLVELIKKPAKSTFRPGVLNGLGGFGGAFELPEGYKKPVLISGTDGVGTKLRLAIDTERYDGIGYDLVAMCVNDILVCGAEPLYFLDYYATGKLDIKVASAVIESIANACISANCALIGGETAEMPGMYADKDFDLAGFSTGIVEKDNIVDGSTIIEGDHIIAIASSGPHSNGYSLIRAVLAQAESTDQTIMDSLLAPTRIYVESLLPLFNQALIKGAAHITGGGLTENLPRTLPAELGASIDLNTWALPDVFQWLREQGNIADGEMLKTFNCGAGMCIVVSPENSKSVIQQLNNSGDSAWHIGTVNQQAGIVSYEGAL